jgi:hypothetical protein
VAVAETAGGAGVSRDPVRHRDAEKVTLPLIFFRRLNHVTMD